VETNVIFSDMKKVILKRTADVCEKMGVGGMLVGIFQGQNIGMIVGAVFLAISYAFSVWEAKL
jgi:hypothetical protein